MTHTDQLAKILWDYLNVSEEPQPSDAILVFGSRDLDIARFGAGLLLSGYGTHLVMAGGVGRLTPDSFARPEAEEFAEVAVGVGVPESAIIIENRSTNTGENVRFTHELLQGRKIRPGSFTLVHKTSMGRRALATFEKQWPGTYQRALVASPAGKYPESFPDERSKDEEINIMVGETRRMIEYPAFGLQIPQPVPENVRAAGAELARLGYKKYLPKPL
jgi:uncharacterized SAM-binding protein YcdF (DUF218 family)